MKLPDFHDRKTQLAAGGAGAVAAFALYRKHQASAAASSSTVPAAGSLTDPVASAAFGASSLENSIVGDLQPQIDSLASQLSGLKAAPTAPPAPVAKPPAAKPPASTPPAAGAPTSAKQFPIKIPANGLPGDPLVVLGLVGPGAIFTGHNVGGGAPVYAIEGKYALQNWDPAKLPAGTKLATLKQFANKIDPRQVRYKL